MTTPKVGDHVVEVDDNYRFAGQVVAVFTKLDRRSVRIVVEDANGSLEMFTEEQVAATEWDPEFGSAVII